MINIYKTETHTKINFSHIMHYQISLKYVCNDFCLEKINFILERKSKI